MRLLRPLALVFALVLAAAMAAPAAAVPPAGSAAQAGGLPAHTVRQLDALAQAKAARSPVERKVDSRLLAELRMQSGAAVAAGVARVQTGVDVKAGRTTVDVTAKVSRRLLDRVRALGGGVRFSSAKAGGLRADLPVAAVNRLAADRDVLRVQPAAGAITARMSRPEPQLARVTDKETRAAQVEADLRRAMSGAVPQQAGAAVSEGVATHAVDAARAQSRVSGIGVKIGVLSDGVDSLARSQAAGELPPDVEVLPGQAGDGDEGTAMLEIIHDVAPGAELAFATAFSGELSFAENIRALRAAGADIIVDDVLYFVESPFQDDDIARAVNDVTADGALYFAAAGNEGNLNDGTAAVWEGDYLPSGQTVGKFVGEAHDFDPGPGTQIRNPMSTGSAGDPVDLFWADPLGGATNDYDLYLLDAAGNVATYSNDIQNGTQDPYELAFVPLSAQQFSVVITRYSGANRFLHVDVLRGRFKDAPGLTAFATSGQTRGHNSARESYGTAAVPAAGPLPFSLEPGDPPNPTGPYPNPFTASQLSERFTNDGPRRVFFHEDGTPITPGNFSSTGGEVRQKPVITAADGVRTSVPGFNPFFGTSAAAPHAAAITALVLSGNPGISPDEVREAITATALDIEAPGTDRDTGAGIIMADRLLDHTGATPQPYVVAGPPAVLGSADGDLFVEPGESASVDIPVTNRGDAAATEVSVRVTTSSPGVVITPRNQSYGTVQVGETKSSPQPFTVSLPASFPLGRPVQLNIRVSFVGVLSPTSSTATLPTGEPSTEVLDFAYTGPPVPIPDNNATGVTVPLDVSGVGPLSRATFSVDGTQCTATAGATTVGIDHTFVNDLIATLRSPSGVSVTLFDRFDAGGNNICQAVFDDSAARSITEAISAQAPFTGSWRPQQPLAALVGANADGTWQLHVADVASVDIGSVRAFSLHLSGFVPPPTLRRS